MKVRVVCLMISVVDGKCYQGELTIGACTMAFKLVIDNDLFRENYAELTGEYAEDTEMSLIRRIVDITILREGKVIDLTDEAYSFINMLLMPMQERLQERVSGRPETQKVASFEGDWDFPPNIEEYLDPWTFPGVVVVTQ